MVEHSINSEYSKLQDASIPYTNSRYVSCIIGGRQFRLSPSHYHELGRRHLFNKIMEYSHLLPERKQKAPTTGFLCCGSSGNLVHAHCPFQGNHTQSSSLGVLATTYSFILLGLLHRIFLLL